jgi:hypothetical protein
VTACSATESSFARTASNIGSAFAAAATTLSYAHEGKISDRYAASSFMQFRSELSGSDQTLTSSGGVDMHELQQLLALYKPAMRSVDAPCLGDSCDWRAQIAALNRASVAFLKAAGS